MTEILTSSEVAEMLGVTEKTVQRYCNDGLLSFYRIGGRGRYNIYKDSVDKLIERSTKQAGIQNPNYTLNNDEKEIDKL